jgi:hypothetical protein
MSREPKDAESCQQLRCHICDQNMRLGQTWFAVREDPGKDTLSIFHRDTIADSHPVRSVCSPTHVCELVVHWMVTGSLDYPFAHSGAAHVHRPCPLPVSQRIGTRQPLAIGELAIDREAMPRVLYENPGAVLAMLNELVDAMERSITSPARAAGFAPLPERVTPRI